MDTLNLKVEALRCAQFSEFAYKDVKDGYKINDTSTVVSVIHGENTDTIVYIIHEALHNNIFIAWRGTESIKDWLTDASIRKVKFFGDNCKLKVHGGFYDCYSEVRARLLSSLYRQFNNFKANAVIVTGHSLGGALATISAFDISKNNNINKDTALKNICSFTYGSPRVGNFTFKTEYNKVVPNTYRFIHDVDIVPRVPKIDFRHVAGMGTYVNSNGKIFKWYGTLWSRLSWYLRVFISNIDMESFKDHSIADYVKAVEKIDDIS